MTERSIDNNSKKEDQDRNRLCMLKTCQDKFKTNRKQLGVQNLFTLICKDPSKIPTVQVAVLQWAKKEKITDWENLCTNLVRVTCRNLKTRFQVWVCYKINPATSL